jgi:outer membrane protein assembly factor BamB
MSRLLSLGGLLGLLIVSFALASAGEARIVTQADWPQFRGPDRTGLSRDIGLLKEWPKDGPPLVWKVEGIGIGYSSVSMENDKIFTMGDLKDASYVFALDRATGNMLWSTKVGKPGGNYAGTRCTPTLDGELLYAIGQFGDLVCLETATGKEHWRKNLPKDFGGQSGGWNYTESPLVDGNKLVCTPGGKNATMVALDKKTGELIWRCGVPEGDRAGYSSMVIADVGGIRQYVQLMAGGVYGIAANDGRFLWKYDRYARNTANVPTPIVRGDLIFVTAGYGKAGALLKLISNGDTFEVTEIYENRELTNRHGGVLLIGDHLYGDRDQGGFPFCAEFLTGKVVWPRRERSQGRGSAAITYADGHLYIRYDNGYVVLVEATPKGYAEKSIFKIPNSEQQSWSHPVVVGGRLYLREKDTLWCYDVAAR